MGSQTYAISCTKAIASYLIASKQFNRGSLNLILTEISSRFQNFCVHSYRPIHLILIELFSQLIITLILQIII